MNMFQVKRESNCQSRIQYPEKDISDMPRPRVYQLLTVTKRPTKLNFSKYSQLLIAKTPQKPKNLFLIFKKKIYCMLTEITCFYGKTNFSKTKNVRESGIVWHFENLLNVLS